MGSAVPYRIDLDDEVIDSIKTFDIDSQRTLYSVHEIRLLPAREFPMDDDGRARFRSRWRELFEERSFEAPVPGYFQRHPAAWRRVPPALFFESVATLFDYLPKAAGAAP
jgi:transcription-repair coupling factor (superfamily II helicase)